MSVTAEEVKTLRERTGAGIMDCKQALKETDGDIDEAAEHLRKEGLESAQSKSAVTAEGKIGSYIHSGGRIGVIVEVNCETDFVANTDDFEQFVEEVSMQIAAQNPSFINREQVPPDVIDSEKEIIKEQLSEEELDKPDDILDEILDGKLEKQFYSEEVLLEQDYIRDPDKTVQELLEELIAEIDENVNIRRFERFEVGEGIDVEDEDFAEEVAEEIG
jgi:elongation factor Ts